MVLSSIYGYVSNTVYVQYDSDIRVVIYSYIPQTDLLLNNLNVIEIVLIQLSTRFID